MKRIVSLVALLVLAAGRPAWAQDDIAGLRAALAQQQAIIAQLQQRLDELERKQSQAVTADTLAQETSAQQDMINSLRETVVNKVNLNGYINARYFADHSDAVNGFQINPLGILMSKQLGRFNLFSEVYLAHIPHHAQIVAPPAELGAGGEAAIAQETATTTDVSGEGPVEVRNAWVEYSQSRALNARVGKFLSPQYFWQNHYPNVTLSTDLPIHLREMFPPELVGTMVSGTVARPAGESELAFGYKFYVANNESDQSLTGDLADAKSWGGRMELHLPARGRLKLLNVAADLYRGRTALEGGSELVQNHVWGAEEQFEFGRVMLNTEYAHGHWLGRSRFGYYVQPAVRLSEDWIAFYRLEGLESARVQEAERRHLVGINYRPLSQVAFKVEYYRSVPLERSFLFLETERKPFSGIAIATALFF